MNQNDGEDINRMADSYELWHDLSKEYREGKADHLSEIVRDAFMTLWNFTCQKSLLVEMPSFVRETKDIHSLDLAGDSEEEDFSPIQTVEANRPA